MKSPSNIKVNGPSDVSELLEEGRTALDLASRGKYSGLTKSQCETVHVTLAKLLDRIAEDHNPFKTITALPDILPLAEMLSEKCLGMALADLKARGDQKVKARKRAMMANALMRSGLCNQSQVGILFNRDRTTFTKVFRNHPTYMKNKVYRESFTNMDALVSEWLRGKNFPPVEKC